MGVASFCGCGMDEDVGRVADAGVGGTDFTGDAGAASVGGASAVLDS